MKQKINDIITEIENNMKLPLSMYYTYSNILKVIEKLNDYEIIIIFGNNLKSVISLIIAFLVRGYLKNTVLLSDFIFNTNLSYYLLSAISSIPLSKLKTGKLNSHEFTSLLTFSDKLLNNNVQINFFEKCNNISKNEQIIEKYTQLFEDYSSYENIFLIEKKINLNTNKNNISKLITDKIENISKLKKSNQKIFINFSYEKNFFDEINLIEDSAINKTGLLINLNKTFLEYIKKYVTNFSENILIKELTNTDKISNTYLFTNFENLNNILNF